MSIKLVDTLESMGNFPVANADGIQFTDGESLQKKLDDGSLGGGGATAESYIELSEEEYLALSDEERASEVEYRTYDTGRIFNRGVEYGKDGVQISDNETVEDKTWSSQKTSDEIAKKVDKSYVDDNFATMDKVVPNDNYSTITKSIKLTRRTKTYIFKDVNTSETKRYFELNVNGNVSHSGDIYSLENMLDYYIYILGLVQAEGYILNKYNTLE